jgi:hypothetical protein
MRLKIRKIQRQSPHTGGECIGQSSNMMHGHDRHGGFIEWTVGRQNRHGVRSWVDEDLVAGQSLAVTALTNKKEGA